MKTRLYYTVYRIYCHHPFTIARGSSEYYDILLVRIDYGHFTGYGEASPSSRYGEDTEKIVRKITTIDINEILQGFPPAMEQVSQRLKQATTGYAALHTALETAIWDLLGQYLRAPLYLLFGGSPEDTPITSFTIGIDTPEIIRQKVIEAEPYPLLKVKLGTDKDYELITTIRKETHKPIRVDANEGWTLEEALEKIPWLKEQKVEFVEQPLPADRIEDTEKLKQSSPLELVADENCVHLEDLPPLARAFHGINIKLMKCGGLLEALKMIHTARALKLKIMLGCMVETSVAITAAAHLSPLVDWADLDGNLLINNDPFSGVSVKDGKLILPNQPGLGIKPVKDLEWQKVN